MYKGYELRNRKDEKFQTFKARPYDDAEYYWALTDDKLHWNIIYNGKNIIKLIGTFEQIVNELERYNSKISKKDYS